MRMRILAGIVMIVVGAAAVALSARGWGASRRDATDLTHYGNSHPAAAAQTATFAAGCFWKLEHAMRQVDGVVATTAGYTGGGAEAADHAKVSTGRTGHCEAVRVVFDPARVSYEHLLEVFWASHDPAQFAPEPGEPAGPGRSAVFYHGEAQRAAAIQARLEPAKPHARTATEVLPAGPFYRAEAEQQQFLDRHAAGSCGIR